MGSFRAVLSLGLLALGASATVGQSKLPTDDEAVTLSRRTGRPIFAMAGRKT